MAGNRRVLKCWRSCLTALSKGANETVVRLTQTGWKDGEEWTKAYEYLAVGNAQVLVSLHHRFVYGPTDWSKE